MATTPSSRRQATSRPTYGGDQPADPAPMGSMQEPLVPEDRPGYRTSDDNDVNLTEPRVTRRTAGDAPGSGRGFATTFIIAAAVLLVAFLVAIYLGSDGGNEAMAPGGTENPVAESTPGTADNPGAAGSTDATGTDATGSTTIAPAPAPGSGDAGGATAPANP